jgi:hypothetical protein
MTVNRGKVRGGKTVGVGRNEAVGCRFARLHKCGNHPMMTLIGSDMCGSLTGGIKTRKTRGSCWAGVGKRGNHSGMACGRRAMRRRRPIVRVRNREAFGGRTTSLRQFRDDSWSVRRCSDKRTSFPYWSLRRQARGYPTSCRSNLADDRGMAFCCCELCGEISV